MLRSAVSVRLQNQFKSTYDDLWRSAVKQLHSCHTRVCNGSDKSFSSLNSTFILFAATYSLLSIPFSAGGDRLLALAHLTYDFYFDLNCVF